MTLPELAIRRPITVLMLLVSLVVIGSIALNRLPLAFLPEGEEPQIWVVVPYPNASPKTMERSILRPIEDALGSIGGLQHMWSTCDGNEARVSLFFRWDEDMATKRVEVRERLDRVRPDLPEDVDQIHISRNWDVGRTGETILEARIASGRDLSHGYELLHTRIVKPLERIPGVASVNLDGVNPREVRVNLKLAELARYNVDVRDVMTALRENNEDRSIGELRGSDRVLMVRVDGSFGKLSDISDLVVGEGGIRLCDVADVSYEEPPLEYGRHLDGQFALGIDVAREAGANTVEISQAIKERVAQMAEDPELEGVNFLIWEDQGAEILKTMRDLRNTGIIGALLASVVLYVFLRRFSSTVFAVLSIPFSLIVACGIVWAKGGTLNTLTLLGLIVGVGMLVDNAIVVMENINRHRENGLPPRQAALIGAREVSVAVVCGTATSVIVFLPIIFNRPDEMNRYLRELGLTVTFTLIASLFVSQTLIPLAMSRFVRVKNMPPTRWMVALQDGYSNLLALTLRHRWIAPVVGLAVIGSGWYPYGKVDKNFEASEAEMFVSMNYRIDQPMSLERKEELVTRVESLLEPYRKELHVDSIYSFWSENWAMTRCYMEDGHTNEEEMNRVRQKLREVAPEIPGVRLEVQDSGRFWERNSGKRLGFRLSGPDSEVLTELALDARRRLETLDGLFDFYTTAEGGRYEVQTRIDRDLAREYGVGVTQAADVVDYTFRGRRLPRYRGHEAVEEVEMSLTLDEREDESIEQLKNLPLVQGGAEDRRAIPLATVADFAVVQGPEDIQRDNRVTGVWIGARFEEDTEEEHMARSEAVLDDIILPYGYEWDHHQFIRHEEESQTEFLITLLLALGLIFAVMAALFESMRQALSLMVSLPFAVAGAAWTLWLTGTDFDQPASVGLLLLLGIVVNNGIVMISHINHYRREGMPREAAMVRGGRERLRPVIMTALTTLLGLLPMVVQRPSLAGVYYYSMALVIMGGLIISTILTTILLPTTVCLTEDALGAISRFSRWLARSFRGVVLRAPARAS
ncbi:MAG: efflux RND transporter permease subunit [Candidatus Eiseniibacteriota bacterium]